MCGVEISSLVVDPADLLTPEPGDDTTQHVLQRLLPERSDCVCRTGLDNGPLQHLADVDLSLAGGNQGEVEDLIVSKEVGEED